MPAFTLFGRLWLAIAPLAAMETTPAISMLDQLVIEAAALRMAQPDQWWQYETNAGEVFAENQRRTAGWKKRSSPPRPDLGPAVQRIDALLAEQERTGKRFEFGGEIHVLLGEMTQIKSPAADRDVARYVRKTGIDPLARLSLLESLVRNRYANSAAVIAHWLREESAPWPDALRRSAERWDEFGQKALQQAERIDFMDARQSFTS